MLNNISILTEDQLDDAVDQLMFAVEEHMEIYTYYDIDDIDEGFILSVAEEIGVNPTPQVIGVILHRLHLTYV